MRIGIALGGHGDAEGVTAAVDRLEEMGVDSLWVQEMVFGPCKAAAPERSRIQMVC